MKSNARVAKFALVLLEFDDNNNNKNLRQG